MKFTLQIHRGARPPFSEGGHLVIAKALVAALGAAGHDAALLQTPQNRFGRQGGAYLSTWLTDVGMAHDGHPIDHVVSFRFPSYAVRHPSHVGWINHRMREYYDQWPRFEATLSWKGRIKERARRRVIHAADRYLLTRNVRTLFAQSKTIQARLSTWGRIPSEVLYPPPPPRSACCAPARQRRSGHRSAPSNLHASRAAPRAPSPPGCTEACTRPRARSPAPSSRTRRCRARAAAAAGRAPPPSRPRQDRRLAARPTASPPRSGPPVVRTGAGRERTVLLKLCTRRSATLTQHAVTSEKAQGRATRTIPSQPT